MEKKYILSVDQSTQGTKALLFDQKGKLLGRADLPHRQRISDQGWVSHDLDEIYQNTIAAVRTVVEKTGIQKEEIAGLGISNQRETTAAWNRISGEPADYAIVWQCSRAKAISEEMAAKGFGDIIRKKTGIPLSPFFPASKLAWILRNVTKAKRWQKEKNLMMGTMDTWLIYKLTGGKSYKTDYSNASRTQLFNLETLAWDQEICEAFGVDIGDLAEVCDSNACYGMTDLEGFFNEPVPIHGVLGDSHGALFGQGCLGEGMVKATYGTGTSVMMNTGKTPVYSRHGIVTSLAWGMDGRVSYVLEGNLNYTGAVVTWMQKNVELIASAAETGELAKTANAEDKSYLVPAFTGLGAPYWDNDARAMLCGMSRMTGKKEIVKAGVESIAYQIVDVLTSMRLDAGIPVRELRVDGGATRNDYLMQFQSDISRVSVLVPSAEELSGIGVAYMVGLTMGLYPDTVFEHLSRREYIPKMEEEKAEEKYKGWKQAVGHCMNRQSVICE